MEIRGRTLLAAMTACTITLLFTADSLPSPTSEAGRTYSVARERLAKLKKSPKRKKYRSYWIDCIRLFESIEQKYPSTAEAADSCFDRAGAYLDLYNYNRHTKDAAETAKAFSMCQESYPAHPRAPEAFYWNIVIAKDVKKNKTAALESFKRLSAVYPDSDWTEKARTRLGIRTAAAKAARRNGKKKESEIRNVPETVIETPKGPPGTVTNVRYWSGGNYTRIVIDQDKPLRFQAHELKNPDRLVFDILHSRVSGSVNKEPLSVNDGILKQVRTSQYAPNTVRVVLDLASLKSYGAFPLHEPERLVIDVTGAGAGDDDNGDAKQPTADVPGTETRSAPLIPDHPKATKPDPDVSADPKLSLSRQLGLKIKTIAIDAGHGGHDPGAIGKSGLKEKMVTLDIAKRLQVLVKERLGCQVVMTRDRDVFIPLEERPFIAKSKGADLFVSVHVNANRKRKVRGIETYIQSLRASDREAMATAALENATSTKTLSQIGSELDRILKDLRTDDKLNESVELAGYVQNSLVRNVRPAKGYVVNRTVKRAFFYVLVNTEMPSILAEVGFISNPDEEKLLKTESYRQKIAEALYQGVKKYVDAREPQTAGL
ncbi:MAG: N-acetylmuramoyl-L-alanine amidase [Nitrospirota bacterium]|nr:N-acetylmuramoyl-L-alanine amidase [Nitrospirota bacterium]